MFISINEISMINKVKIEGVERLEMGIYKETLKNYQFGLANTDLRNFSSKNMSILFKKSNTTAVSKELFENLTKGQKKDMVSFKKLKFKSLLNDGTITKYQLDQLAVLASYLRVIFQEDEHFNVHILLVYKEKPKGFLCGKTNTKSKTSVILNFVIKQEEILELLKENPETTRLFGESIEFNVGKLVKIFNKLFMSRSSNKA